ncbi:MAG TPA: sugar phosphate isomerase/epimerase family protein [Candidatus Hydrogenedens sp.]|nr:sugar phosphate isomerase/epimerase [Candidatus Hydrogenedens sp.]HOK08785.1 sugar phosphate isomerase/epimerase family protein [Candidatus Hydrogenedens sp.]HOL20646.1 sugar phosphate isomerase/epimerase family protein [Candidatus Hydrogenedens sp.]HPP58474.1 sugar phosphate isomerase/epimerase family protein [Candidatus Hydrogenedens sp.]
MQLSRRSFLKTTSMLMPCLSLTANLLAQEQKCKYSIAACDWSMWTEGPSALDLAKQIGLNGVEISAGKPEDKIAIANVDLREQYKTKMKETGIQIPSIAMGLLNDAPFANDPRAVNWLIDTIDSAKDLGAKVILLAFFGKGDLKDKQGLKNDDIAEMVNRLKEVAPKAKESGIILGIENTLTAQQNMDILDKIGHEACKIYYDVGNSTYSGYDVPAEIRMLKDKICQIHFKDGAFYLGKGKVKMEPIVEAIKEIQYQGWLVLETGLPKMDKVNDFQKNYKYLCEIFS